MKYFLLTAWMLCSCYGMLHAGPYHWQGYVNGVHPAEIYLEQEGQALGGYWVFEQDTFGLEGQIKDERIHLLEFYDGLWTATLQIRLKHQKPHIGYWFSREKKETFWLGFDASFKSMQGTSTYRRPSLGSEIVSSRISARDGCIHYIDSNKEWQFRQYVYEDSIRVFGPSPSALASLISYGRATEERPMRSILKGDYFRLVEIFYPRFQSQALDELLNEKATQFLSELETQGRSLELRIPSGERDRYRWHWNAYTYIEVYQMENRRLSMILHSKDFKGNTRAEAIHWNLQKDRRIYLNTELKNPESFKVFRTKYIKHPHEVALHPKGVVLVSPFHPERGIQRVFLPYREVRKFYRFFSILKWWR